MPGLVRQVRQVGASRAQRLSGLHRLRDTQMSRVRPPPECIEHQYIESTKLVVGRLRNRLDVGDVGQAPEAVAEHPQMTVLKGERKDIDAGQSYWPPGLGGIQGEPGLRGSLIGTDRII